MTIRDETLSTRGRFILSAGFKRAGAPGRNRDVVGARAASGKVACADGCYTFSEDPTDDDTCDGHGGVG